MRSVHFRRLLRNKWLVGTVWSMRCWPVFNSIRDRLLAVHVGKIPVGPRRNSMRGLWRGDLPGKFRGDELHGMRGGQLLRYWSLGSCRMRAWQVFDLGSIGVFKLLGWTIPGLHGTERL